jgi:hypothetical protein
VTAVALSAGVLGWMAISALRISNGQACPSTAEIEQVLAPLHLSDVERSDHEVVLSARGQALVLTLLSAGGQRLAERELARNSDCRAMASAAALVIVTWEADLSNSRDSDPAADPLPEEAKVSGSASASEPETPAKPAATVVETLPQSSKSSKIHLDVGAALLVSAATDGAAPAGIVVSDLHASETPWVGVLTLGFEGTHDLTLVPGSASWQRFTLSAGGAYRLQWSWGALVTEIDGVLGLLAAHGNAQANNLGGVTFDPGLRTGTRLLYQLGTVSIWAGAWALWFPHTVHLVDQGETTPQDGAMVPHWEVQVGAGASLSLFCQVKVPKRI